LVDDRFFVDGDVGRHYGDPEILIPWRGLSPSRQAEPVVGWKALDAGRVVDATESPGLGAKCEDAPAIAMPGQSKSPWYQTTLRASRAIPASASASISWRSSSARIRSRTARSGRAVPWPLAGAVGGVHDGDDGFAVHAGAELGDLVAGSGPDVLGDRCDLGVADGRQEIAPEDQLLAGGFRGVAVQYHIALRELGADLGGRQVRSATWPRTGP
jgi:hypothetical protein